MLGSISRNQLYPHNTVGKRVLGVFEKRGVVVPSIGVVERAC